MRWLVFVCFCILGSTFYPQKVQFGRVSEGKKRTIEIRLEVYSASFGMVFSFTYPYSSTFCACVHVELFIVIKQLPDFGWQE